MNTASGAESVIYAFKGGSDGAGPQVGVIDIGGKLYGTTTYGDGGDPKCRNGCGTIFTINPATGAETILNAFTGHDGHYPHAALISIGDDLYGATDRGTKADCGAQLTKPLAIDLSCPYCYYS